MRNKDNARKLTEIEVTAIAFTEAPANKRRFLLLKNDAKGGDKVMPEKKEDTTQGSVSEEALKKLLSTLESVVSQLKEVLTPEPKKSVDDDTVVNNDTKHENDDVEKKGAVFSAANKKLIQSVIDMLTKALKTVEASEEKDKATKTDDDAHDHEAHDDEAIKSAIEKLDEHTKTLVTEGTFKEMIDKVRKEMVTND